MTNRKNRNGFTLLELLAGLTAASMIALTAGLILFYAYRALRQDQDLVQMQQDGSTALFMLARAARDATNVDLSHSEQLDIQTTNGVTRSLYVDPGTRRLYFTLDVNDPNAAIAATTWPVVTAGFTYSNVTDGVGVHLVLQGSDGPMVHDTIIHLRN
jgi:prepilin-type N-terminal cleavage/methylation domain-containing protein